MAESLILTTIKKTWDAWNIRGFVLISLALQVFLFLFSPFRKRTKTSLVSWSLWLAYLLADYVATFCIGLIFNKRQDISSGSIENYILVFWAPFLLLHLGGADTITAFALEDNKLWPRHLLGLAFQGIIVAYVFFLTIPGNALWIPTVLVFVAGMIKYVERILSLYLASMDTLRKSIVHQKLNVSESPVLADLSKKLCKDHDVEMADLSKKLSEDPDVELVRKGFLFFNKFKGLVVDMTYSYNDRNWCREFFLSTTPEDALTIIEAELGFMYEFFFTKEIALRSKVGCFLRCLSISSVVVAFVVFFNISNKKQHGFSMFEKIVTYILFSGAVAQDIMALLMLAFSDRNVVFWKSNESRRSSNKVIVLLNKFKANVCNVFLKLRKPKWSNCKEEPYTKFKALSTPLLFRRWCGNIPGHDFVIQCIHKGNEQMFKKLRCEANIVRFIQVTFLGVLLCLVNIISHVIRWKSAAKNSFPKQLWEFIFLELQRKSVSVGEDEKIVKIICEERGAWIIQNEGLDQTTINNLLAYVNSEEIAFDESLIVWHIATILCYCDEVGHNTCGDYNDLDHRHFSKLLSDYMMYLLVGETSVTSAVAGIGPKRILEISLFLVKTSAAFSEIDRYKMIRLYISTKLFRGRLIGGENKGECVNDVYMTLVRAIFDGEGNGDKLLNYGYDLASKLIELPSSKRWEITAQVWVEMMSFAAINCRPDAHVQQLSKGGQLLSFVWLLMIHFGLSSRQFQFRKTEKMDKDHPSRQFKFRKTEKIDKDQPNMNEKKGRLSMIIEAMNSEITSAT